MARPVVLKRGQFLLFFFAVFMIGLGAGLLAAGLAWRLPHAAGWASLAEIPGLAAFVVMSIWKSLDDWAERTGSKAPSRT